MKNSFIFIQMGARRNYAIPRFLGRADMLSCFATDIAGNLGYPSLLKDIPLFKNISRAINLFKRTVPHEIVSKTITTDGLVFRKIVDHNLIQEDKYVRLNRFRGIFNQNLIKKVPLGHATHVFSMFTEGLEFMEHAHTKGLKTIAEIYIAPSAWKIVEKERRIYPGIECPLAPDVLCNSANNWQRLIQCTDHFVVPSDFVRNDMINTLAVAPEKIHIIPYAVNESWFEVQPQPVPGRVLFVGTAELRKGIHVLAETAKLLADLPVEFVIAGHFTPSVSALFEGTATTFLGRVPRHQIREEYQKADIFVLPSLAEGSAEVVYEALASQLPVITTAATGSVVRDQQEGFIIPERDSMALAESIKLLVKDRKLRAQLAQNARTRAQDFSWQQYEERLIEFLEKV